MGLSKACFSSMLEYDNDGDESPMHVALLAHGVGKGEKKICVFRYIRTLLVHPREVATKVCWDGH
jgi:hypothetical protein